MKFEILDAVFISVYAILYSMMEIEIEGTDGGWAKNLKTVPSGIGRFTCYHLIMNIIVILTIFYALIPRCNIWTVVFFTAAWFAIEDTFWFILNPGFTLTRYKQSEIWWHAHQPWPCGIPMHNWVAFATMLVSGLLARNWRLLVSFGVMAGLCGITIAAAPLYHALHKRMRRRCNNDDE